MAGIQRQVRRDKFCSGSSMHRLPAEQATTETASVREILQ
jgi:hypothetical protein